MPQNSRTFSNPQSNPQHTMSCTTSACFGSPRALVSCCKTKSGQTDKGEVGGSSPPRPTIQITSKHAAILTFPLSENLPPKTDLSTICQLLERPSTWSVGLPATIIVVGCASPKPEWGQNSLESETRACRGISTGVGYSNGLLPGSPRTINFSGDRRWVGIP